MEKLVKAEKETSDIREYLTSFNREIEEGDESDFIICQDSNDNLSDEICGYLSKNEAAEEPGGARAEIVHLGAGELADDPRTLEAVAQLAAREPYQTVTVVPSDTNPGELSYVVFVSDEKGEAREVFDGEDLLAGGVRAVRLASRRSPDHPHACAHCSYASPKRHLLSRHMKSHSDERPHRCGVCGRGFKTVASLHNHVNTHTGVRPYPCRECASCFTTSGELVRHVRYKHTHEKPHKCTECEYASVELSKLKRHMRCHTGERPYACPHCTYASPDTYKLKRHLRIHTGEKPYQCDVCAARFTQSNSLKAHKLIHSGNKPVFRCEYCPTTCGRKTDLRIHVEKLHSSDKPHRCKPCGKVFLDRYSYKLHVRTHEGEKCYRCDLCDYASMSQRHLETHMLVHTDRKPFRCDECDASFRQKQLLRRHRNLYHDPDYVRPEPGEKRHACSVCPKAFRHRGNLMRHLAFHDPVGEAMSESRDEDADSNQQVVVFEVIQLPGSEGLVEGDVMDSANLFEEADDEDLATLTGHRSSPLQISSPARARRGRPPGSRNRRLLEAQR